MLAFVECVPYTTAVFYKIVCILMRIIHLVSDFSDAVRAQHENLATVIFAWRNVNKIYGTIPKRTI